MGTKLTTSTSKESPLAALEEIARKNRWGLLWSDTDETMLEVSGQWTENQVFLIWRPEGKILHVSVALGLQVTQTKRQKICDLLASVNERQWAGHFDLCSKEGELYFRHTLVGIDAENITPDVLEDMIGLGVEESALHYPVFDLVLSDKKAPREAIDLATLEVAGHA